MVQSSSLADQDVEFDCQRRAALLISMGNAKGQESLLRFRQRIIKIGLFETFEIEEVYQPTKLGLENRLKRLE